MMLSRYFALAEAGCRDGSPVPTHLIPNATQVALELDVLRAHLGLPIRALSWYRTPAWNARVKGAPGSMHLKAKAVDIRVVGVEPVAVHAAILDLIAVGRMADGGLGLYPGFVHYDTRLKPARW